MLKSKQESQNGEQPPAQAGRGVPPFFRKIRETDFKEYKRRAANTAFGKYLLKEKERITSTKGYEIYLDAKNAILSEDSPTLIMLKRTTPFVDAYWSWRYASQIRKTNNSLRKSAAFFEESMRHFKREDAPEKLLLMKEALGKAKIGVISSITMMVLAAGQALWLARDMVRAFIHAPPAMGFIQKISEIFKDAPSGAVEKIGAIGVAISIAVYMGIHYAFYMMERARKLELLAQDRAFLTDSELAELLEITARQKKRAEQLIGHESEKEALKKAYEQLQDESVERRHLGCYAELEKAKKAMVKGEDGAFRAGMQEFIGALMWHGKFARIEIVAHAAGMNGPDVAEIAKDQVRVALAEKKYEIASHINKEYCCFTDVEFASLLADDGRV